LDFNEISLVEDGASNDVSVVDVKSRKELRRIKVGDGPWGIAIVNAAK
jgi:YVTN family beta-propeller protein